MCMIIKKDLIPIFRGIDLSTRKLPLLIADSKKPGPVVYVTAAIHGDEVTGTAVIQSLFKRFEEIPLMNGILYTIPILNPSGFETISRSEMYGDADINRYFSGDEKGSTPERLAALILSQILSVRPDYVIDLHTDTMNSISYTLVDLPTKLKNIKTFLKCIELAKSFGFAWAVDTALSAGFPPEDSLTGRLMVEDVTAVTLELGGPMVVSEEFRVQGLEAIWGFLQRLEMVKSESHPSKKSEDERMFTIAVKVRTQQTGIIHYGVRPGQEIHEGQLLGKIRNVFGETIEIIRSPVDGWLFSHEDQSITFPGRALFTIAIQTTMEYFLKHVVISE